MNVVVLIFLVSSCTIGSQLLLKSGINQIAPVFRQEGVVPFLMSAAMSPWVLGALCLQVLGYVLWFFVLTQARLSVAFAISGSFFYLLMAAASWLVFSEKLNGWQWLGLGMISAGVLIVNLADSARTG
ncbi:MULTISPECIES: hypothetical protein [Hydrogenophaga]|uniref:EamA domain-containing protein n=1 Tax=Hydrogenophaga electricum TaxID=1230953 RepID=A0ABQ6C692_9BURK|nr:MULTISPECIES: hypothetical protein [Hydrogenophaga]GLS13866.1 hypothetical protein GCM10007935_12960 [Hydrogenophaga electricum]